MLERAHGGDTEISLRFLVCMVAAGGIRISKPIMIYITGVLGVGVLVGRTSNKWLRGSFHSGEHSTFTTTSFTCSANDKCKESTKFWSTGGVAE